MPERGQSGRRERIEALRTADIHHSTAKVTDDRRDRRIVEVACATGPARARPADDMVDRDAALACGEVLQLGLEDDIAVVAGGVLLLSKEKASGPKFRKEKVTKGEVVATVTATGVTLSNPPSSPAPGPPVPRG